MRTVDVVRGDGEGREGHRTVRVISTAIEGACSGIKRRRKLEEARRLVQFAFSDPETRLLPYLEGLWSRRSLTCGFASRSA